MKIEIEKDGQIIDTQNLLVTNFKKDIEIKREQLSNTTIDFSSINKLKGDKYVLNLSFRQQITEELNP